MLKLLVIIAAILLVLWILRKTCTNNDINLILRAGEILMAIVLLGGIVFWWFGDMEQNKAKIVSEKITAFEQGRILVCNGIPVSNKDYNFSRGTLVFIGNTAENRGNKIELKNCEISQENKEANATDNNKTSDSTNDKSDEININK